MERAYGVRKDHKSNVLWPLKPLLKVFWGPPVVHFDNIGPVNFFFTFRVHGAKKVKHILYKLSKI
jgi:hypothetical protein